MPESQRYYSSIGVTFNAARMLEEHVEGRDWICAILVSADELTNSEVVSRPHIEELIRGRFHQANLNSLLQPADPTTENIARAVGQLVLDYLFKVQLDSLVRLHSVRIGITEYDWVDIRYRESGD